MHQRPTSVKQVKLCQTDSCPQQNPSVKAPSEYHRDVIGYIDRENKHDWARLGVDRLLTQKIRDNIILDTTIRPSSLRANLMCCCLWTYDMKYFGNNLKFASKCKAIFWLCIWFIIMDRLRSVCTQDSVVMATMHLLNQPCEAFHLSSHFPLSRLVRISAWTVLMMKL